MKNEIKYEWCHEILDDDGDIIDMHFEDKLSDLGRIDTGCLCLIRDEGNEAGGLRERYWAYVKDGIIPERFADSEGKEIDIKVPERFKKELAKHLNP